MPSSKACLPIEYADSDVCITNPRILIFFLVFAISGAYSGHLTAQTTLTFEGLPENQAIGSFAGVVFSPDWLGINSCAAGGTGNFVNPPSGSGIAFVLASSGGSISFDPPVSSVTTRYVARTSALTITALDSAGHELLSVIGPQTAYSNTGACGIADTWGTATVSWTTASISSVRIHDSGNYFAIDDLTYSSKQLAIVRPTASQDYDLGPHNFTASDPITFEARATPSDATRSVDWDVLIEYQTSGNKGASQSSRKFKTQAGRTYDETYASMGGRLTVKASATINSQTVNADPVTATITGVSLADDLITVRLVNLYGNGATPRLMTGIAKRESNYAQFAMRTLYGRSDRWPNESFDGGSHIGLMQMPVSMERAWNWESNATEGVDLFREKLSTASRVMRRIIQKNKGLRDLTGVELENMALVLYGPYASGDLGKQYYRPVVTSTGGMDWVVNSAGNANGVIYANYCRSHMQ